MHTAAAPDAPNCQFVTSLNMQNRRDSKSTFSEVLTLAHKNGKKRCKVGMFVVKLPMPAVIELESNLAYKLQIHFSQLIASFAVNFLIIY